MIGIVVCGGKSTRMGTDKCSLNYHGKPQHDHICEMLLPICESVYISCNARQMSDLQTSYPLLPDVPEYADSGPISALMTAFEHFPGEDLLLVGCDYPLLTSADLAHFIADLPKESLAAAFYNSDLRYEPLLAFYKADLSSALKDFWNTGDRSLQMFLRMHHAGKHFPRLKRTVFSADTPEDAARARIMLNKKLQ